MHMIGLDSNSNNVAQAMRRFFNVLARGSSKNRVKSKGRQDFQAFQQGNKKQKLNHHDKTAKGDLVEGEGGGSGGSAACKSCFSASASFRATTATMNDQVISTKYLEYRN